MNCMLKYVRGMYIRKGGLRSTASMWPVSHSLFVCSFSWGSVWMFAVQVIANLDLVRLAFPVSPGHSGGKSIPKRDIRPPWSLRSCRFCPFLAGWQQTYIKIWAVCFRFAWAANTAGKELEPEFHPRGVWCVFWLHRQCSATCVQSRMETQCKFLSGFRACALRLEKLFKKKVKSSKTMTLVSCKLFILGIFLERCRIAMRGIIKNRKGTLS